MPQTLAAIPALVASATAATATTAATVGAGTAFFSGGLLTAAGAGATLTFGATAGISIGGLLTSTALSLATSTISGLVKKGLSSGKQPRTTSQEQQATFTSTIGPRFFYFGRAKRGGDIAFVEEGPTDGHLYRLLITDCGPTDAIERHLINNEEVTLDANGWITEPAKWASIQIVARDGDPEQSAIEEIHTQFPGVWTEQHRLRGLSNAMVRQAPVAFSSVLERYPNGARGEAYTQIVRAAADIYDPRTGSTGWSRNAALVFLWALTHPSFGGLSLDDMNLDAANPLGWQAAADKCDVQIENADGEMQPQWTLSGRLQAAIEPTEVPGMLAEMLACFDAEIFEDPDADGKISIRIGVGESIEDGPLGLDHLLSWEDEEAPGLLDGYEAVRVEYIEPRLGYAEHVTPPVGAILPDRIKKLPRPFIDNYSQAQRIARRSYLRTIASRTAKASTNLAGLLLPVGAVIEIDLPIVPDGEAYVVTEHEAAVSVDRGEVGVRLSLELVPPDYEAWDAATDEVELHLPPILDGSGGVVSAPEGLRGAADQADDGTVRVVWDAISLPNISAELEWSEAGADDWSAAVVVTDARARVGLLDASSAVGLIDVRARFVTTGGQTSWSQIDDIDPGAPLPAQDAPDFLPGEFETAQTSGAPWRVTPAGAGVWKVRVFGGVADVEKVPPASSADGAHLFGPGGFGPPHGALQGAAWTLSATVTNLSGAVSPAATIQYGGGSGGEA